MERNLDMLHKKVKEHQSLIGRCPLMDHDRVPYIRDLVLATHVELTEFLNELPWKPWKHKGTEKYNQHTTLDELADVVVFILDIALALDINVSSLLNQVYNKIDVNIARLKSGIHKPHE